jgi:insulysin
LPNAEDINSSVCSYYQAGALTIESCARLMLLAQLMKEPAFTQLRTKEQLGYICRARVDLRWRRNMVGGILIEVLSKTHAPEVKRPLAAVVLRQFQSIPDLARASQEIGERIEAFVKQFREQDLENMVSVPL